MTALTTQIEAFLKERKCTLPEIGLLQPADPILNAAGEDIRRRIFITSDQRGQTFCLRPEFTIPVCLAHIESGQERRRYGYAGKVFRQRSEEPAEFLQAGIEDIGAKNLIAADARSLREAVELCRELGKGKLAVTIGDQAIFEAVLKSMGLPKAWRERLGRAFGDEARISADLERLSGNNGGVLEGLDKPLAEAVEAKDREAVTAHIEKQMQLAGLSAEAGRSPEEITTRLLEKAQLASTTLSQEKREILGAFLRLDLPLAKANTKLWSFVRRAHIPLGKPLEDFHKRAAAIEKLDLQGVTIRYKAGFGRQLDYYTGFVFELRSPGQPGGHPQNKAQNKPLAGGGRYDRLLTLLDKKASAPAIGFAVYVDRVVPRKGGAA